MPPGRERRDYEHRHARTVAKEVERLNKATVIQAAALVKGDDDRGLGVKLRVGFRAVDNVLDELLQQTDLAAAGMALKCAVRLDKGNCGQIAARNIFEEIIGDIFEMRRPALRISHNRFRVLEWIANVAIAGPQHLIEDIGRAVGDGHREVVAPLYPPMKSAYHSTRHRYAAASAAPSSSA